MSGNADIPSKSLFPLTRYEVIPEEDHSPPVPPVSKTLLVRHIQGGSEQQYENPLQVLIRTLETFEAPEAAEVWVSEVLPSVSLSEAIEPLDAALNLVPAIFEQPGAKLFLSQVKSERIRLWDLLSKVEREIHQLLHEWEERDMECLGFSKTDIDEVTAAFAALLPSADDYSDLSLLEDLSNRLHPEETDKFISVLICAIDFNYPNHHELLGTILLRTVEQRRDPRFTMKVLTWAAGENNYIRHLDSLMQPLAAQAVPTADLNAITGLIEGLPPTLPWLPDTLICLLERLKREEEIPMAYSLLRNHFERTGIHNRIDFSTGVGKYFLELAMEFGRDGDDASSDELEWIITRARRGQDVDIALRWRNEIVMHNVGNARRFLICLEKLLRTQTVDLIIPGRADPRLITLIDEFLELELCKESREKPFWKNYLLIRTSETVGP